MVSETKIVWSQVWHCSSKLPALVIPWQQSQHSRRDLAFCSKSTKPPFTAEKYPARQHTEGDANWNKVQIPNVALECWTWSESFASEYLDRKKLVRQERVPRRSNLGQQQLEVPNLRLIIQVIQKQEGLDTRVMSQNCFALATENAFKPQCPWGTTDHRSW